MTYDVALVGTGPEPDNPVWGESAAMACQHAAGYRDRDDCNIVACADFVRENAENFADESPVEWVIGQIDYREVYVKYGAHNENQGLVQRECESGELTPEPADE